MDEKKRTVRYVTNTEAFREAEQKEQVADDARQAIANTEKILDQVRKMREEIDDLKIRVAALEKGEPE